MKPEQKLQWMVALLSGDYEQGRGRLRTADDKYCCLGVECEVAAQQGMGRWVQSNGVDEPPMWQFIAHATADEATVSWRAMSWSSVPVDLLKKVGALDSVSVDKTQAILQKLNDESRASFETIAQWIEENVEVDEDTEVTP